MRLVVIAIVMLAARTATAGICLGEEEFDEYLGQIEAAARSPAKAKELSEYWGYCLLGNEKRKARIVKACTTVIARLDLDAKRPDTDVAFSNQAQCVEVLASFGVNPIKTKTKNIDLIGDLLAKKIPAHDDPTYTFRLLELSKDPRVVGTIAEQYRAHVEAALQKPPTGWRAQNWIRWHRGALSIIERLGGTKELELLDYVKANHKDARVKAYVEAAQKAIAKRSP
jgi:hypothetical protein